MNIVRLLTNVSIVANYNTISARKIVKACTAFKNKNEHRSVAACNAFTISHHLMHS